MEHEEKSLASSKEGKGGGDGDDDIVTTRPGRHSVYVLFIHAAHLRQGQAAFAIVAT